GDQPDEGGAAGRGRTGSGDVGERADGVWSRAVTGSGETDPATREPRGLVSLGGTHELRPRDPHRINARANVGHTRNAGTAPQGDAETQARRMDHARNAGTAPVEGAEQ